MPPAAREAGLDALRVTGAFLVLFAHGGYFLFPAWPVFDAYVLAGWLGTEVFFALTGFLVMREVLALDAGELRLAGRYVAWRLLRILPLFWLALAVRALLGASDAPPDAWRFALLAQNLAWPHPSFFGEAWNLPIIVLFSLFAPGLLVVARTPWRAAWIGVAALLAVGLLLRAGWIAEGAPRWDEDVRKIVLPRLDACAWGALAALLHLRTRVAAWMPLLVAMLALAAAVAMFWALPRDASAPAKFATFTASGIGMAALCLALARPARPRALLARLARWVYPLYLANMPLLIGFSLIGFGQTLSPVSSVLRFVAWVVASLALAALLHYVLERPLLEWGRARLKPSGGAASSRAAAKTGRGRAG